MRSRQDARKIDIGDVFRSRIAGPGWEEVIVTLVTSQRANIFAKLHFMVREARKISSLTGNIFM